MSSMCRDILNTCIRNTEEAEKAGQPAKSDAGSGRGQGKGVWLMIEESELAKSFRKDDKKKVEAHVPDASLPIMLYQRVADMFFLSSRQKNTGDVLDNALACKSALEELLLRSPSSSPAPPAADQTEDLPTRSRTALQSLAALIESTDDPSQLEGMLALNDELTSLLARVNARRPELKRLKGLGINVEDARLSAAIVSNGHASSDHLRTEEDELEEEIPVTPRIDKGKGRAEPEPEEPPPVLSPTLLMPDYDFEYAEPTESLLGQVESIVSPTDRYVHFNQTP